MPLVVVEQNGTRQVDASLEMSAKVQWHPDRSISIELGIGKLSIPADPALAFRLGLFVAGLIAFLNLMILSRIRIPPLELFGVELAPRIPTITTPARHSTSRRANSRSASSSALLKNRRQVQCCIALSSRLAWRRGLERGRRFGLRCGQVRRRATA